jgi:hypothetical protein
MIVLAFVWSLTFTAMMQWLNCCGDGQLAWT